MKRSKIEIVLYVVLALVLAGLCWWASNLLGWWFWSNTLELAVSGLLSLLLGGLVTWCIAWGMSKVAGKSKSDEQTQRDKDKLDQMLSVIESDFHQLWQQSQRHKGKNKYGLMPWYFLLNEQPQQDEVLLNQMGFQIVQQDKLNLPITFWVSDFAIVVGTHTRACSDVELEACLELVLKLLNRYRPRQAANGVLFTLPAANLLNLNNEEVSTKAKEQRNLLNRLNKAFGLNLPVYSVFTDMVELADFCQFFSVIDEQKLEQPFGAMMPVAESTGYQAEWFSDSFDQLQDTLSSQVYSFLRLQLNTDYRKSILVAPYQFGLLKTEIEYYFQQLFLEEHFSTALNFRGYYFVNASREGIPVDRLSMLLASRLGNQTVSASSSVVSHGSMFAKKLFSQDIVREAGLVGVNGRRENLYTLLRFGVSGSLAMTLAGFVWLLWANFEYYQGLDAQALNRLDSYKSSITEGKFKSEDLQTTIFSLSELRDIAHVYDQPKPWYVVSWLPDPSIAQAVDQAYRSELQNILLIALRDYLRNDLYIYNKLGNKVETLVLFNLHQLLNDHQRATIEPLVNYYLGSLREEGESDGPTLIRFKELIEDLLKTGVVPPEGDQALIQVVQESLSNENVSDLMYQHILEQPPFNRRVDLRPQLGSSFTEVFRFKDGFSGYLAPYIFTREGFEALMLDTDFLLVEKALKAYENMAGSSVSKAELSRITRQLKRRYVEEYIAYWKTFADNIESVNVYSWNALSEQLTATVDPVSSPVRSVYEMITFNTQLTSVFESAETNKALAAQVVSDNIDVASLSESLPEGVLDKSESILAQKQQDKVKVANTISQPFKYYHQLIEADKAGQSALDKLIQHLASSAEWVKRAMLSEDRGKFFFKQLSEAGNNNPLAQLQSLSDYDYDVLLQGITLSVAERTNQFAMEDVRTYLNKRWQDQVVRFYSNNIRALYPFNAKEKSGVNLNDFKTFFGPQGTLERFSNTYLGSFETRDNGSPVQKSFLPGVTFELASGFWKAQADAHRIQKALFEADNFTVDFTLKTQSMSSGLTEFSIRSDTPLFVYRHGPAFWTRMTWPLAETQSRTLDVWLKNNESTLSSQSYQGDWSWFRLAEAMDGKLTREKNISALITKKDGQYIELQLQVEGEVNPFVKGFFNRFRLPESI
ncbi:type VI secretion system membrane subunit TssM [Litoribrevibacter euphylliae]|uniref:Type VI secretion system membrane subunit TssM n=1 Tax=Litoribrevibacter euphylliae TaxID=1834034 RepID=A0ABV7HFT0_9GAMM